MTDIGRWVLSFLIVLGASGLAFTQRSERIPSDRVQVVDAPYPPSIHLKMGNPSGATANVN